MRIMCSLFLVRNNNVFNWLAATRPKALNANIHPYCFSDTLKSSMNTAGEPAIYAYKPADAIAPVKAYVKNCGSLITLIKFFIIGFAFKETDVSACLVSGNKKNTSANNCIHCSERNKHIMPT